MSPESKIIERSGELESGGDVIGTFVELLVSAVDEVDIESAQLDFCDFVRSKWIGDDEADCRNNDDSGDKTASGNDANRKCGDATGESGESLTTRDSAFEHPPDESHSYKSENSDRTECDY